MAHLNWAAIFNFSTYFVSLARIFLSLKEKDWCQVRMSIFSLASFLHDLYKSSRGFAWHSLCCIFWTLFENIWLCLISNFSKFFLVFRVFLLSVWYEFVTVLTNKGKGVLELKVASKAISTSSPASLNSLPSTSFIGTSDEFLNFWAMSVSQAQHKLDTTGEINLINSLWSSLCVRHV